MQFSFTESRLLIRDQITGREFAFEGRFLFRQHELAQINCVESSQQAIELIQSVRTDLIELFDYLKKRHGELLMRRTIGFPEDQIHDPLETIFEWNTDEQRGVRIFQILNKALQEISSDKAHTSSFWEELAELIAHTYRNQIGVVFRQNDKTERKEISPKLTEFQKCLDKVLAGLKALSPKEEDQSRPVKISFTELEGLCKAAVERLIKSREANKRGGYCLTTEEIKRVVGAELSGQQILLLQRALFFIAERNRSIRKGSGEIAVDGISSAAGEDIQSNVDATARLLALNILQHLKVAGENGHCAFVLQTVNHLEKTVEGAKTTIDPHIQPCPGTPIHVLRESGLGQ